jgi:hypothetical protein
MLPIAIRKTHSELFGKQVLLPGGSKASDDSECRLQ